MIFILTVCAVHSQKKIKLNLEWQMIVCKLNDDYSWITEVQAIEQIWNVAEGDQRYISGRFGP